MLHQPRKKGRSSRRIDALLVERQDVGPRSVCSRKFEFSTPFGDALEGERFADVVFGEKGASSSSVTSV
jgi:hypothetical protein